MASVPQTLRSAGSAWSRHPNLLAARTKRSPFEVPEQRLDAKAAEREQMLHFVAEDVAKRQRRSNRPEQLTGHGVDLVEQESTFDHLSREIPGELFVDEHTITGLWMHKLSASVWRHRPFARRKVLDLRIKDVKDQPPVVGQMLSRSLQRAQLIFDIEIVQGTSGTES
jgi:hypothetical protein